MDRGPVGILVQSEPCRFHKQRVSNADHVSATSSWSGELIRVVSNVHDLFIDQNATQTLRFDHNNVQAYVI